ncbi:MAG: hypothetical protein SPK50_07145 [Mobiluncus porci]|uniref:hypothetical protein n=1 Tax=Mobiluncus porci TaxID=2652278 RepID=UPI0023F024AD|nr:hypothetical protein [Mobiluncus porci]MDD7541955.1 hypothetical protein [Mobiluncus porci]MDY5748888.1 hypothetical protein [Mobiluncus porci]
MTRQTPTAEEQTFLDKMRTLLLSQPEDAALTSDQSHRILRFARHALRPTPALADLAGPTVRTGEVCDWLGVSRQAVAKATREKRILGFQTPDRKWHYPQWQFESPELYAVCVKVLPQVLDVLASRGLTGPDAAMWFLTSRAGGMGAAAGAAAGAATGVAAGTSAGKSTGASAGKSAGASFGTKKPLNGLPPIEALRQAAQSGNPAAASLAAAELIAVARTLPRIG